MIERSICLVINSLEAGGAERVLTSLANEWAASHWKVKLITFRSASEPFYKLHPAIELFPLGLSTRESGFWSKFLKVPRLIFALRQKIKLLKPDVTLAFMDQANMLTLLANLGLNSRIIVAERVNPARGSITNPAWPKWLGNFLCHLRNHLYKSASRIVVQTKGAAEYFPTYLQSKIEVIPNSVQTPEFSDASIELPRPAILAMGRLNKQKRFDLLISAFNIIAAEFPNWNLVIVGEGPERQNLDTQIGSAKLSKRVSLPGLCKDPANLMRQASIFVLTSDYEGFPGVLCEAMAVGLPVIATNCPFGPADIIVSGKNGLLIPCGNAAELADALRRLLGDDELRDSLGRAAQEVTTRFEPSKIMAKWIKIVESCSS